MSSPFDDTPESLVELRTTVMDWVKKSRKAVLSFKRDDGSFWRDTKQYVEEKGDPGESLSPTVTARSYTALVAADRCLGGISIGEDDNWKERFADFVKNEDRFRIAEDAEELKDIDSFIDPKSIGKGNEGYLNRFEVAHLADFVLATDYINRFYRDETTRLEFKLLQGFDESKFRRELGKVLLEAFKEPEQACLCHA